MTTLKELLHLTHNEDGIYILSWKRPDFQVENEYESAEISKEDFGKIGNLLTNSSILEGEQSEHLSPNKENEI